MHNKSTEFTRISTFRTPYKLQLFLILDVWIEGILHLISGARFNYYAPDSHIYVTTKEQYYFKLPF